MLDFSLLRVLLWSWSPTSSVGSSTNLGLRLRGVLLQEIGRPLNCWFPVNSCLHGYIKCRKTGLPQTWQGQYLTSSHYLDSEGSIIFILGNMKVDCKPCNGAGWSSSTASAPAFLKDTVLFIIKAHTQIFTGMFKKKERKEQRDPFVLWQDWFRVLPQFLMNVFSLDCAQWYDKSVLLK